MDRSLGSLRELRRRRKNGLKKRSSIIKSSMAPSSPAGAAGLTGVLKILDSTKAHEGTQESLQIAEIKSEVGKC